MSNDGTVLELMIARHGETARNLAFRARVSQEDFTLKETEDPLLTENGVLQACLLGERLSAGRLSAVFSSPLTRALATASETAKRQAPPLPVEIIPELAETGINPLYVPDSLEEIRRNFPEVKLYEGSPESDITSIPVGEHGNEYHLERAQKIIAYFRARFTSGEKILAVAHGGFNTYLLWAALGFDAPLNFGFCQHNTSLSKIKYYPDGHCRAAFINDTSHLYPGESSIAYNE